MSLFPSVRLVTPNDHDAHARVARWQRLGIREAPDPEFDEFSRVAAQAMNAPIGMVNLVGPKQQYLAGLYPFSQDRGVEPERDPMRSNGCDTGFCLYTVTRKHALALDEVMEYHLFAGNPIIEALGVRAYLGAPLIDRDGEVLGTLCVVDTQRHSWGTEGVTFIKAKAAEVVDRIYQRAELLDGAG